MQERDQRGPLFLLLELQIESVLLIQDKTDMSICQFIKHMHGEAVFSPVC